MLSLCLSVYMGVFSEDVLWVCVSPSSSAYVVLLKAKSGILLPIANWQLYFTTFLGPFPSLLSTSIHQLQGPPINSGVSCAAGYRVPFEHAWGVRLPIMNTPLHRPRLPLISFNPLPFLPLLSDPVRIRCSLCAAFSTQIQRASPCF